MDYQLLDRDMEDLKAEIRAEDYYDRMSEESVLEKEAHERGFESIEAMQEFDNEAYLRYRDRENA